MTNVQTTLRECRLKLNMSQRDLATAITAVLSDRSFPPQSISNSAISLNEKGVFKIKAITWEYVRDHAAEKGHPELVELATAVLAARASDTQAKIDLSDAIVPAPTPE